MRSYIGDAAQGASRFSGATLTSTQYGISTTTSGVAHTKGAWVEIIASTGYDSIGLLVNLRGTANNQMMTDIGVGAAGSEKVLVPNIFSWNAPGHAMAFYLPIRIPAGTRLSARSQTSDTTNVVTVQLIVVGGDMRWARAPRISCIGVTTSTTRGTTPATGGFNSKGAWTELSAATAHDFHYCVLMFGVGNTALTSRGYKIDIGVGASTAEKAVLVDFLSVQGHASADIHYPVTPAFPLFIPSGSRVSVRYAVSNVSSPQFDIAMLGVDA